MDEDDTGLDRLMMFSDGVFAIAITLLVLPLTDTEIPDGRVGESLAALWPQMFTFALSFAVIGRYWMIHHKIFRKIVRSDARLLVLNLLYLFCIAFLPFPTSVLGEQGEEAAVVVLYAGNLIAIGLVSVTLWWYASSRGRLVTDKVSPREARASIAAGIAPTLGLVPSIPLAFLAPDWAKYSWLLIIPFSIVGERLFPQSDD
ncbi:MAG: TMEM175 family protein [Pseudonocardia sediminis]